MKIVRFVDSDGQIGYGAVTGDDRARAERLRGSIEAGFVPTGEVADMVRLLAPVAPPNILCIGLNYRRHAAESNMAEPERPILFLKPTSAVIGPDDPILLPPQSTEVDYECELAVVIGRAAKNVSHDDAIDYVFGVTCGNDVSARDWQLRLDRQWARGKGFDTFCPLGPVLVTRDECPDPDNLRIETRVNGELLQSSNTADMIFSVRQIISYLSQDMTLLPGTVILTGTPEGVGMGRTPNRWLRHGDLCEVTLEGVGTLQNPVHAA